MEEKLVFTPAERAEADELLGQLRQLVGENLHPEDASNVEKLLRTAIESGSLHRNVFGLNPIVCALQTALIAVSDIGLKRDCVIAVLLYDNVMSGFTTDETIHELFGGGVSTIIRGLVKVQLLYKKNPKIESENFRNLLLSFAEDMRVILIMIADRVNLMRQIRDTPNAEAQHEVSEEASYLYAPLAHKLGLYQLKSELEDLSLKYLEHDAYYMIKEKLNATKKSRDAYIKAFIGPVSEQLTAAGLKFHIKGRTKSIHSIWQKMKKQQFGFEGIYDLFAIRVILDSPEKLEKMQCWQAYSIVTNMYQPNPKRLRDWLSVPKSNGYESLHITVLGPERKWVEVQIRTERMDEWLAQIRSALEAGDDLQVMDQFRMDLYEDEVFVFTPKGDLLKFPKGATVLDFAYHIHTKVGNGCVGGKINGRNVSFRAELHSGDTVEVLTSTTQRPKQEWLSIVKSAHAKAKVRLALKETQVRDGLYAKEMLERRFKNKKIDIEEPVMAHLLKKLGIKEMSDFYKQIADGKLDMSAVIDMYQETYAHDHNLNQPKRGASAEGFAYENPNEELVQKSDDVLVIDRNLKGLDFSLARCCHPIYGDPVFGFVTISGGIKIHRQDCPNAAELKRRFGYRVVKARWSGKGNNQYAITLRIIGNDDIGIVNNITNIISKEEKINVRSINIDSHDGLFSGNLVVLLEDNAKLTALVKKLRTIKGVKQVSRI